MAKRKLADGSTEYFQGGYKVIVKPDGGIRVQFGDSLSKYSMAIHGDFKHLDEYLHTRQNPNRANSAAESPASRQPITNYNLIFAGETIFHKPSINPLSQPTPSETPLTEAEIRDEIERILREEYGFSGTPLRQAVDFLVGMGPGAGLGLRLVNVYALYGGGGVYNFTLGVGSGAGLSRLTPNLYTARGKP